MMGYGGRFWALPV